jgi:hypothetical protein
MPCLPPSLLVDCCLTAAATVFCCLPLHCHWCGGKPIHHRSSLCFHSCIPARLCHPHQWLIVDLLSSVIPCLLHCPPPYLVVRHLLHHLPSLHCFHRWLVVVFCQSSLTMSLTHFIALGPCHCRSHPPPHYVRKVWVARSNSLAGWPFLVPLATR